MKYATVSFEIDANIGKLLLLKAPQGAAEMRLLIDEVSDICTEIREREAVRVVVIGAGSSDAFSVKVDLVSEWKEQPDYLAIAERICRLDQPVIAGIPGDCIGPGLEIALACDIRLAAAGARFGLPHIKVGLIPLDGGTQRLPRLVGKSKALEMILTGDIIDAREALRIGLVNRVVSKEEAVKVAMDMAGEIASKGPIALRYAKEAVLKGMDMTLEQGLRLEADLYLLLHTTKDRSEGITAFRDKKKPQFEGK
jgi:enoyl-CoA hydratase/carnithine racemase